MDAIPVISQLKSAFQAVFGDLKGAKETQINFSRKCPVVSQIRSAVEVAKGDKAAARQTQKECGYFILSLVEGTPVIGHAIGTGYYIAGKRESGDEAMKNASRTSAVIAGGVIGFIAGGGPIGATVGGNVAGAAMDGMISGIDSAVHKCYRPFGILTPTNDPKNVGKWVDAVFLIGFDALTGYTIGRTIKLRKANAGSFNDEIVKNIKTTVVASQALTKVNSGVQKMFDKKSSTPSNANGKLTQIVVFSSAAVDAVDRFSSIVIECCEGGTRLYKTFEKSQLGGIIITFVKSELKKQPTRQDGLHEGSNYLDSILTENQKDIAKSNFVRKSDSLGNLSELDKLKEENALNFDEKGLDLRTNSFDLQENILNGRKIYLLSQSSTQSGQKLKPKRRKSCYF